LCAGRAFAADQALRGSVAHLRQLVKHVCVTNSGNQNAVAAIPHHEPSLRNSGSGSDVAYFSRRMLTMNRVSNDKSEDPHIELTPVEARQAIMTGHMRYVLGISLALSIIVLAIIVYTNLI
jgi:hypothetical protein